MPSSSLLASVVDFSRPPAAALAPVAVGERLSATPPPSGVPSPTGSRGPRAGGFLKAALLGALLASGCDAPPAAESPGGDGPALVAAAGPAAAEPAADDAEAAPAEDPAAAALAEKMLAVYRGAQSYADNAVYVQYYVLKGEGVDRELPFFQMSLAFQRPNKLRLRFEEAVAGTEGPVAYNVACDGRQMLATAAGLPLQVQCSVAPDRLTTANFLSDPLIRQSVLHRALENVFPQLAMLLNVDDRQLVFPQDEDPRLRPDAELRGRRCRRLATRSAAGERIFWIDAENYLLRRMELPIESERQALDPNNEYLQLSIRIDFLDAALDVDLAAETFALEAPPDARRLARLVKPPRPAMSPRRADEAANRALLAQQTDGGAEPPAEEARQRALDEFYNALDAAEKDLTVPADAL